ncbi:MAG: hypothetical protein NTW87_05465 [Planctomycetota bacterium]|nr:hypothetical protein [Planctomycetota bacterium]
MTLESVDDLEAFLEAVYAVKHGEFAAICSQHGYRARPWEDDPDRVCASMYAQYRSDPLSFLIATANRRVSEPLMALILSKVGKDAPPKA